LAKALILFQIFNLSKDEEKEALFFGLLLKKIVINAIEIKYTTN